MEEQIQKETVCDDFLSFSLMSCVLCLVIFDDYVNDIDGFRIDCYTRRRAFFGFEVAGQIT